jgi:hypothetical protein
MYIHKQCSPSGFGNKVQHKSNGCLSVVRYTILPLSLYILEAIVNM